MPNTSETDAADPADESKQLLRLIAGATAVICLVFVALVIPIPFKGRVVAAIGDLAHAPLFGGLAIATLITWQWISPLASASRPSVAGQERNRSEQAWMLFRRGIAVWIVLTLFGAAMEYVQSLAGRQMSMHDAFSNSVGIVAAIVGYAGVWFARQGQHSWASGFAAATLMVLLVAWWHPIVNLADCVRVRRQFPLLASFESRLCWTRLFFEDARGQRVPINATEGRYSLETHFGSNDYTFVSLNGLLPNWEGYDNLEFDAFVLPNGHEDSLRLLVKIFDEPHHEDYQGTFITSISLKPGKQERIRIPMSEIRQARDGTQMDLTQIGSLELGIVNPTGDIVIRFDRVILTRDSAQVASMGSDPGPG